MKQPSQIFMRLLAGLALPMGLSFGASACSSFAPSKDDSAPASRPIEDSGKPSEEGEGLPGFLTDPSLVQVHESDSSTGATQVTAPGGTIIAGNESLEELFVQVIGLSAADYEAGNWGAGEVVLVRPSSDGSFVANLPSSYSVVVVNVISEEESNETAPVESTRTAVKRSDADASLDSTDDRPILRPDVEETEVERYPGFRTIDDESDSLSLDKVDLSQKRQDDSKSNDGKSDDSVTSTDTDQGADADEPASADKVTSDKARL